MSEFVFVVFMIGMGVVWPAMGLAIALFYLGYTGTGIVMVLVAILTSSEDKVKIVEKVRVVERIVGGGRMTKEEAYSALGINPGATRDAIIARYRDLMQRVHPDRGGSTYLAQKVNEARKLLAP